MLGVSLIVAASVVMQASAKGAPAKLYTSARGGYSVAMPTGFVDRKRQATLGGDSVELQVVSRKRGGTQLSVASGDLASEPADVDAVLAAARDDVVAQAKGKLGEDRPIKLGEIPGREFRFAVPKQVVAGGAAGLGRVYVAGRGVYQVVVIQSTSDSINEPGEPARFVGSFRLDGARATARTRVGPRTTPATAKAVAATRSDGVEIESKEWRYRVRFPGKPVLKEGLGEKSHRPEHLAQVIDNTRAYLLQVTRLPVRVKYAEGLKSIEALKPITLMDAQLVSWGDVKGQVLGREIVATADRPIPGAFIKSRGFATGRMLYEIAYVDSSPNASREKGEAFLNSLQILSPEPFALDHDELPDSWKTFDLPAQHGRVRLPEPPKSLVLGTGFEEQNQWDVKAFMGRSGQNQFIVVVAEKPSAGGKYTDMDHETVARAVSRMGKGEVRMLPLTANGRVVRFFTADVKDYLGQGERVVSIRTSESKARIYGAAAITLPGLDNEAIASGFFATLAFPVQ